MNLTLGYTFTTWDLDLFTKSLLSTTLKMITISRQYRNISNLSGGKETKSSPVVTGEKHPLALSGASVPGPRGLQL